MRLAFLSFLVAALSACGGGVNRQAADACMGEVASRLVGKRYDVDVGRLAGSAAPSAASTLQLSAPIVFDRGTETEYTQTIQCRVRLDEAGPAVVFLQFDWNMDDVRKTQ
ncbi:MAG: hypothetical protein J0L88_01105 [Xanthomonadales bacterium]|nr:hypothetical protein [Xanthomonadales bacterium]